MQRRRRRRTLASGACMVSLIKAASTTRSAELLLAGLTANSFVLIMVVDEMMTAMHNAETEPDERRKTEAGCPRMYFSEYASEVRVLELTEVSVVLRTQSDDFMEIQLVSKSVLSRWPGAEAQLAFQIISDTRLGSCSTTCSNSRTCHERKCVLCEWFRLPVAMEAQDVGQLFF